MLLTGRPTGSVSFPIDFFEHCQQTNDIEVGLIKGFNFEILWYTYMYTYFTVDNIPCTFFLQFGGNDLLQIYNAQQIKHRLNTIGMYVASTKV